jgi:hypothetical protein
LYNPTRAWPVFPPAGRAAVEPLAEGQFGLAAGHGTDAGDARCDPEFITAPSAEGNQMADRETIVTTGGGSAGLIAGIVIVAVLVIAFFVFFNNGNAGSGTVDIDVPAVSVDVVPDGQ